MRMFLLSNVAKLVIFKYKRKAKKNAKRIARQNPGRDLTGDSIKPSDYLEYLRTDETDSE